MKDEEFWRKPLLFGLGLLDFTREKVEALAEEMVKRGEINRHETPEAVKLIMAKAQEIQQTLADKVEELTGKAIAKMNLARVADLAGLEKRLTALEKEIEEIKKP